jgi:hypothetical protein
MVGIPDGLGAFDNYDGTFTLLMNHEIPGDLGVERQHGFAGAFVSHWIVRKSDLAVLHGGDHAKRCGSCFAISSWSQRALCFRQPELGADSPPKSSTKNASR